MKNCGLKYRSLIVAFVLFYTSLYGDALVYRVSDGKNSLYLGGTIHVLSTSDYPLAKEYFRAFERADILYFETDLAATKSAMFSKMLITALSYPPHKSLRDDLNASTYAKLKAYTQEHNIPLESLERFKVGMAGMNILVSALNELNINAMGVDEYFYIQAKEHNKAIASLESLETQVDVIAHMGQGVENEFILSSLHDAKNLKEQMFTIVRYFKSANAKALDKELLAELRSEYPKLYNTLILKRNRAWMDKIKPMLQTKQVEFILVGSMHLVGRDGLLEALKKEGYSVSMLKL